MSGVPAYPAIDHLLGAGFHQDVWEDFSTWQEVVAALSDSAVFRARLPREVAAVLAASEEERAAVMGTMTDDYTRMAFGMGQTDWLRAVAAQVERDAPATDPRFASLVGQRVESVEVPEAHPGHLRVDLSDGASVLFVSGIGVTAPGGAVLAPGLERPAKRRGVEAPEPVGLAQEAVGEVVLVVGEARDQLYLATPTVRIYAAPHGPRPWFVVSGDAPR